MYVCVGVRASVHEYVCVCMCVCVSDYLCVCTDCRQRSCTPLHLHVSSSSYRLQATLLHTTEGPHQSEGPSRTSSKSAPYYIYYCKVAESTFSEFVLPRKSENGGNQIRPDYWYIMETHYYICYIKSLRVFRMFKC